VIWICSLNLDYKSKHTLPEHYQSIAGLQLSPETAKVAVIQFSETEQEPQMNTGEKPLRDLRGSRRLWR
jgi:hypothetical protein